MAKNASRCLTDAAIRLRPGCFSGNVKMLLDVARWAVKAGYGRLALPRNAIQGGDCGSAAEHPAFRAALAAAEAKFRKGFSRIANPPEIVWVDDADSMDPQKDGGTCSIFRPLISSPGPDPRFPFGGRPGEVFARQTECLARRLAATGCKAAVVGLSGGLDSALALLATVEAFDMLGIPRKGVRAYTMPGFGTTRRTRGNAELLASGLGVGLETIDITSACRQHFKDIRQPASRHDVTFENAQARERTQVLMDKANQLGGIVVGTGDMSEIALGWCTFNGDHMSMFGVNAGVPKTVVREVCRWWAEDHPGRAADALIDILDTPVSPELLPSVRGKIAQKTEDRIGPYELHDFFLWHFVAERRDRKGILAAARKAFRGRYAAPEIAKWLDVFLRRVFSQSFKRNCAPDGARVFKVYLSPDAWRVPSDFSGEAFL